MSHKISTSFAKGFRVRWRHTIPRMRTPIVPRSFLCFVLLAALGVVACSPGAAQANETNNAEMVRWCDIRPLGVEGRGW